jgi:hypothetical protein
MRIEKFLGPCNAIEAEAMGYVSKDGRWLSDRGERKRRVKEMASARGSRRRVADAAYCATIRDSRSFAVATSAHDLHRRARTTTGNQRRSPAH